MGKRSIANIMAHLYPFKATTDVSTFLPVRFSLHLVMAGENRMSARRTTARNLETIGKLGQFATITRATKSVVTTLNIPSVIGPTEYKPS